MFNHQPLEGDSAGPYVSMTGHDITTDFSGITFEEAVTEVKVILTGTNAKGGMFTYEFTITVSVCELTVPENVITRATPSFGAPFTMEWQFPLTGCINQGEITIR